MMAQHCWTCPKTTPSTGSLTSKTAAWRISSSFPRSTSIGDRREFEGANTRSGTNSTCGRVRVISFLSLALFICLYMSQIYYSSHWQLRCRASFRPLQQKVRQHGQRYVTSGRTRRSRSLCRRTWNISWLARWLCLPNDWLTRRVPAWTIRPLNRSPVSWITSFTKATSGSSTPLCRCVTSCRPLLPSSIGTLDRSRRPDATRSWYVLKR